MSCSADSNHGIVQFSGPILSSDINALKEKAGKDYFPFSFSFAPRTTLPTLLQTNHIEDSGNSCFYNNKRYNLLDIQICSVLHKGYKLPTENQTPVAECILTYHPSGLDSPPVSALLIAIPIYIGPPAYDAYLDQLVNDTELSCSYENQSGKTYEGADQATLQNSSLRKCIKACCDDTQCLAYTFGSGTCHIKHTIPNLLSAENSSTISGKIKRNLPSASCAPSSAHLATIESMFYRPDGTTDHVVISYPTCFETVDTRLQLLNKYSLRIMHFSKGIRMTSQNVEKLVLQLQGSLLPYEFPPVLRNNEATLTRYRMNDGKKVPTESSKRGQFYQTTMTSCSDEFRNRFEYMVVPPRSKTTGPSSSSFSSSSSSSGSTTDPTQCKRYTTSQYKCVPFNEDTDLSSDNLVIPGNTTLEEIRKKQKEAKEAKAKPAEMKIAYSSGEMEAIIGGSIGGGILVVLLYYGISHLLKRPS